ncbi:MAG: hypothetical protein IJZ90_04375 [Clostridia bacterium]|nr:hypothetical protein [Clostridia bacterium]
MDTVKLSNKGQTKMIAHRGLRGIETENTNAAFVAAGNRSYYGIETDVHRTSDGKFVIIHDDTTLRVSGKDYTVEKTDFDTLRSLQLYDKDSKLSRSDLKLPELSEYIRICERYKKECILELKNEFSEDDIYRIIHIIEKETYLDHVTFISFSLDNLLIVKKKYPYQPAQLLCGKLPDSLIEVIKENNIDVDIHYSYLTDKLYSKLRRHGLKINCWTCDSTDDAKKLIEMGVDYITTNILE